MAKHETFTSRWGLVLAAMGMAVGTGNIWRFPRIVAKNGGGAFLIPWIIFLFLWSIPLLIGEFAIGKKTRKGAIGAFATFIGPKFAWMGSFVGFCTMAIMFYYSVVMGWCLRYVVASLLNEIGQTNAQLFWETQASSGLSPILFHFFAMFCGAFIVYRGVVRGIERASRILIPSLAFLLVVAAVSAITLPGATAGLNFFFNPDWSALLSYRVWLEALSQSAWSTGAGWGLILTYAVYLRKREDIVLNSFIAGLGNNSASILAGLAIFPAVFALAPRIGIDPQTVVSASGPASTGMAFIWMPELFKQMPAGQLFATLFFLALTFAALSSLIAMIELAVRIFMDAGLKRKNAILLVAGLGFLLGLPSAASMPFFENQDWAWGVGLILSGFFFAFAINMYGVSHFRQHLVNNEDSDFYIGKWVEIVWRFVIPLEFIVLTGWWFYQAITVYEPNAWWNPLKTFSVGTCVAQWGIILGIFFLLNKWIVNKMT